MSPTGSCSSDASDLPLAAGEAIHFPQHAVAQDGGPLAHFFIVWNLGLLSGIWVYCPESGFIVPHLESGLTLGRQPQQQVRAETAPSKR